MQRPGNPFNLSDWRRSIATLYADVREVDGDEAACSRFRRKKDLLFATHSASPLDAEQRARFRGLQYFAHDPAYRVVAEVQPLDDAETIEVDVPEGRLCYVAAARASFVLDGNPAMLTLFWILGYGGGLFLPFRDETCAEESYGGGRYLYDTIKGADLGADEQHVVLDFNYAYNPSCAYSHQWICPLAPPENRLNFAVRAGEKDFPG